ncbi:unnamed protein product [Rhodiola kirilowii]
MLEQLSPLTAGEFLEILSKYVENLSKCRDPVGKKRSGSS